MLTGGADQVEATGVPHEGFVRLAPVTRPASANHRRGVRPGAGVVLSFLVAVGAGMASLQALIPWAPWRAAMQAAGALVMFGGLGIWARLTRGGMAAGQPCACERLPVWIRVIPSVAQNRQALGETLVEARARRPDHRAALVEATGVTRS
jgi:hypothetical protein